jgi:Rrf2 family protein
MITREADYALRAVIYLARAPEEKYCPTSEICREMLIPYRFLRKISRELVNSGLVKAHRGKQGGLVLNKPPEKITVLDILRIFDERALAVNLCCKDPDLCCRSPKCEAHKYFQKIQSKLEKEFASVSVADLVAGKAA